MAFKILADTSILIDLQKGIESTITSFDRNKKNIKISRITACEFIYGSLDKRENKINRDFLDRLETVEINEAISRYTYQILDKYGFKMKLGISDAIIAATAIMEDYQLWTLNTKHFRTIRELNLFKP